MPRKAARKEVSLPEAARRLGVSWSVAYRFLLTGELRGELSPNGRWSIDHEALEKLARRRARSDESIAISSASA